MKSPTLKVSCKIVKRWLATHSWREIFLATAQCRSIPIDQRDGSKENSKLATGRGTIAGESFSPSRGDRHQSPVRRRLYLTIREKAVSPHRARIELRNSPGDLIVRNDHRPSPRINDFDSYFHRFRVKIVWRLPLPAEPGKEESFDRSSRRSGFREKDLAVIFYSATKQRGRARES